MGYNGPPLCRPKHVPNSLWCIWHRCPSIAHLVPQSGSPTLLQYQINSSNEKTLAWERERTGAIKNTCLGEWEAGVVGLIDLFIHVGLCAHRCQLSHIAWAVPKSLDLTLMRIMWHTFAKYGIGHIVECNKCPSSSVLLGKWEERERERVKKYH